MSCKVLVGASFLPVLFFLNACKKNDAPVLPDPDPCVNFNYTVLVFKTESIGTLTNGSITINFPVGDTVSYKLNNGSFQSSPVFNNLSAGNYVVTLKNHKGCTDTAQITILNYGPKYALVKQIIGGALLSGYCGPCHLNGGMSGGVNFDSDATILNKWDRIKARTVDGTPSFMPQAPNAQLTPVDKQKIADWVNAGHRISD